MARQWKIDNMGKIRDDRMWRKGLHYLYKARITQNANMSTKFANKIVFHFPFMNNPINFLILCCLFEHSLAVRNEVDIMNIHKLDGDMGLGFRLRQKEVGKIKTSKSVCIYIMFHFVLNIIINVNIVLIKANIYSVISLISNFKYYVYYKPMYIKFIFHVYLYIIIMCFFQSFGEMD